MKITDIHRQSKVWKQLHNNKEGYLALENLLKAGVEVSQVELRGILSFWIERKDYFNWFERLIELRVLNGRHSERRFCLKYGEEEGLIEWKEWCKNSAVSLPNCIKKYGEEEGRKRFKEFCDRKKGQATIEYNIKRYGEIEGRERWAEYQRKRKVGYKQRKDAGVKQVTGRSLEGQVQRYGEEEGTRRWEALNEKQRKRFSIEYYIKKYGEEEGRLEWEKYKLTMVKTSLKAFVKKYGEEEGTRRYEERNKRASEYSGMGLKRCIERWGEEEGKRRHESWVVNTAIAKGKSLNYSKVSQKLFWRVYESLTEKQKNICHFAELNEEQMFVAHRYGIKVFFVDFKVGRAVIEFNGTYWHSSEWQKERDIARKKTLKEKGYFLLEITEKEFSQNPEETIIKCINFIKKKWNNLKN